MVYPLLRSLLFRLEPETAHTLSLNALRLLCRGPVSQYLNARIPPLPCRVMGLDFPNPIGLAAGLDKNADYLDALGALGFGFIEVGTVTPRPQPGNPRPRLFRLPQAQGLINRLGFNNQGVRHVVERIRQSRYRGVLGVNIGKNRDTPLSNAVDDYLFCLREVYPHAHYITVNISSPNTPGLRDLQRGERLDALLAALQAERVELAKRQGRRVPLAVKIAPDLSAGELEELSSTLLRHGVDAVIATNTTATRLGVEGLPHADEEGGLSGRPLLKRSTEVVRQLRTLLDGRLPIIAVGGILGAADAQAKLAAGASLIQLYTGFIYRGPGLVREIAEALRMGCLQENTDENH
ncbi:MAG: quinone-dependent dihydroorotate dehydrogenase [Gammaproteobacteria bacterium]|nr:quinone-dependent dihydroorotate dehydrogenase [Gammaproteobacteria bacterium]